MRARRDLFPTDTGLMIRMTAVGLATPLVVLAGLVAVLVLGSLKVIAGVFLALLIGVGVGLYERVAASSRGSRLSPAAAPALHAIVERLCLVGDLAKPAIVLEHSAIPNSWIEGTTRGGFRLHLTRGLLDLLAPRELEAVVAHELAHVANRDAAVMTVVGGPGEALLAGGVRVAGHGVYPFVLGGAFAAAIGWLGTLGTRSLSRHREFAADAGAVALTGNPAALATALMKVSEGMVAIPKRDLRAAAVGDAFHLVPARTDDEFMLPPTHPPLAARIERLQQLERALQSA